MSNNNNNNKNEETVQVVVVDDDDDFDRVDMFTGEPTDPKVWYAGLGAISGALMGIPAGLYYSRRVEQRLIQSGQQYGSFFSRLKIYTKRASYGMLLFSTSGEIIGYNYPYIRKSIRDTLFKD